MLLVLPGAIAMILTVSVVELLCDGFVEVEVEMEGCEAGMWKFNL